MVSDAAKEMQVHSQENLSIGLSKSVLPLVECCLAASEMPSPAPLAVFELRALPIAVNSADHAKPPTDCSCGQHQIREVANIPFRSLTDHEPMRSAAIPGRSLGFDTRICFLSYCIQGSHPACRA
ncbi:hypothetical protein E3A20_02370, partial [Planctomyces bekefii]